MKDASILVDYIYLDSEERRRFAQVGHEYLIEQVQFTGEESIADATNTNNINGKFKLAFNHPCKELIWALRCGAFNGESSKNLLGNRGRFLAYTHDDGKWEEALDYAAENVARGMIWSKDADGDPDVVCITLGQDPSGNQVCAEEDTKQTTYIIRDAAGNAKTKIVFLHDCLPTSDAGPKVCIHKKPLVCKPDTSSEVNLADHIQEFYVTITMKQYDSDHVDGYVPDDFEYTVDVVQHSLTLNEISLPIDTWEDNRSTTDASNGLNPYDCSVVQINNYGVRLDGRGNPMREGNLQLNGHDRFEVQEGSYFNYVQPFHHHTRTPADGINVYSFGLHPEQHQPNGTANLSRIDNTQLNIRFADPFRADKKVCALSLSRDSKFYVFAFSYNVLEIPSIIVNNTSRLKSCNEIKLLKQHIIIYTKVLKLYNSANQQQKDIKSFSSTTKWFRISDIKEIQDIVYSYQTIIGIKAYHVR